MTETGTELRLTPGPVPVFLLFPHLYVQRCELLDIQWCCCPPLTTHQILNISLVIRNRPDQIQCEWKIVYKVRRSAPRNQVCQYSKKDHIENKLSPVCSKQWHQRSKEQIRPGKSGRNLFHLSIWRYQRYPHLIIFFLLTMNIAIIHS